MSNRNFTPRVQPQVSAHGETLRKQLQRAKQQGYGQKKRTDVLPNLESIGEDGKDHINIWEHGATELGKCLSHDVAIGFVHPVLGKFNSVVGFFNYIRSEEKDDRLRHLSSKVANLHFKSLTPVNVKNFKALVMDANWLKVQQNPALKKALMESELPFDSWYTYKRRDGVRQRPAIAFWIVPGFNEIRAALKEGREPDWSKIRLLPKDVKDLYEPIRPVYAKPEEKVEEVKPQAAALLMPAPAAEAPEAHALRGEQSSIYHVDEAAFTLEKTDLSVDVINPSDAPSAEAAGRELIHTLPGDEEDKEEDVAPATVSRVFASN
jgi:hypothetical protein